MSESSDFDLPSSESYFELPSDSQSLQNELVSDSKDVVLQAANVKELLNESFKDDDDWDPLH